MATFKFGRTVDIHWNGYEIAGPAETVFSIPDQLYEEFNADIAPVEPTLVWIDPNEFVTLSNSVSVTLLDGTFPISITTTTAGRNVSISSSTNPAGYTLVANGSGGVIFQAGSSGSLTSVVGVSPISSIVSGNTASVSINQSLLSVNDALTASTVRSYVKNSSGSTITKGQAVYVTGSDGTNALIGLASASSDAASSKTLGIAASTMTNNAFGYVIENGQLANIDTSAATAGSSVWLGATPGSIVFNTPPAEPNHFVYLGVVTKSNVSTGEILVKVQNGYELNELHDVFATGVTTALPLVYNAVSDGWIPQALTSVGIAAAAVGSAQIAASAVGSAQIAAGAVGSAQIAASAVNSAKIAAGAVGSAQIGTGAVGSAQIGTGAIVSTNIAAGAVDSAILANNAVVAAKIAAAAVGTAAINSGSAASGQVLTANGSGAASFATPSSGGSFLIRALSGAFNGSAVTAPAGEYHLINYGRDTATVVTTAGTFSLAPYFKQYLSALSTLTSVTRVSVANEGITWTTRTTGIISHNVTFYGNGTYVIIGQSGTSTLHATSADGFTWSSAIATSLLSYFPYDMSFGNNLFITAGDVGSVPALYTSISGSNWTSRTSGFGTSGLRSTTFGNNLYLIGGQGAKLATSSDAITWTIRTTSITAPNEITALAYGNGLYLAGAANGQMSTSTDGINWTARTSIFSSNGTKLSGFAYGNGTYVAAGNSGQLASSANGTSWTTRTSFTTSDINAVAYGNGLFAATGVAGTLGTSTDGITWTSRTSGLGTNVGKDIAFGDGLFIAVSANTAISTSPYGGTVEVLLQPVALQSV